MKWCPADESNVARPASEARTRIPRAERMGIGPISFAGQANCDASRITLPKNLVPPPRIERGSSRFQRDALTLKARAACGKRESNPRFRSGAPECNHQHLCRANIWSAR
jgi:hypothetical protein